VDTSNATRQIYGIAALEEIRETSKRRHSASGLGDYRRFLSFAGLGAFPPLPHQKLGKGGSSKSRQKAHKLEPQTAFPTRFHAGFRYQGTFCMGAHAMAGTQNAFLDHTQSSLSWHDYSINGRKVGELAQRAVTVSAAAQFHGVTRG
jgi:hypothetical protein